MREQISGLLLFFNVQKNAEGKWVLEFDTSNISGEGTVNEKGG